MTDSKPAVPARNPGTPLTPAWLAADRVALEGVDRRAAELQVAGSTPPEVEAERLIRAVRLLDLTTLEDADTADTVHALCARALSPLSPSVTEAFGDPTTPVRTAAVCTWDRFAPAARAALSGSGVRVAVVSGGFPEPLAAREERVTQVREAVSAGADEIDAVITRELALARDWSALHAEVAELRAACGSARLKVILRAGALGGLEAVYEASYVGCMAGADFIKSSTGREETNATLPIGLAMTAALRAYGERSGFEVGFKPAGGIRTAEDTLAWLRLVERELGRDALDPSRFRIGASSLLGRLEARLSVLADALE